MAIFPDVALGPLGWRFHPPESSLERCPKSEVGMSNLTKCRATLGLRSNLGLNEGVQAVTGQLPPIDSDRTCLIKIGMTFGFKRRFKS